MFSKSLLWDDNSKPNNEKHLGNVQVIIDSSSDMSISESKENSLFYPGELIIHEEEEKKIIYIMGYL